VRSREHAGPPAVSDDSTAAVTDFIRQVLAVAEVEIRKLLRDPTEVFTRSVQPALWLVVFGQVFARMRAVPTGAMSYLDFMTPGILAQSVLFTAIFYGIAIIWERDLGILQKMLVTPAFRGALVLGKAVSAGARGIAQTIIVYVIALALGIHVRLSGGPVIGVLVVVVLGSALFSTFSLVVACVVKTRERFMGIGQVVTMPLFFASNAIYPIDMMPDWLKVVAKGNPLTYLVDALRALMVEGGHSVFGLGIDVAVQFGLLTILVLVAARLYPSVAV
jgi:ABC-2 type transport system permease protein